MKTKLKIKQLLALFLVMFVLLSGYLVLIVNQYGTRWFTSPYNTRVQDQKGNIIAGSIGDRNGNILAYCDESNERKYNPDKRMRLSTALLLGDNFGQTIGADAMFAKYLLGYDQNVFERLSAAISGEKAYGSNVTLTVDAELSSYTYDQMGDFNGAVILLNYKTGEILTSVSKPAFDPARMKDYLDGKITLESGEMVNRVTMGQYAPGSVFKIVTLLAAIRYIPNAVNETFNCSGQLLFDEKTGKYVGDLNTVLNLEGLNGLIDYQGSSHGELSLKSAFTKSCNNTFGLLAMKIGNDKMAKTAYDLGIGREFLFSDMLAYSSSFTKADKDIDLAWSGAGQYKDIMTPLNMALISASVANGGVMPEPKLLRYAVTPGGAMTYSLRPGKYMTSMNKEEAGLIREYMLEVVKNGTGKSAQISGYEVGGKTGTAEVTSDGSKSPHAWFTGFVYSDDHPLAICVILENGGSGGSNAAPVAQAVLKRAIRLGY
ncbi:MAG: penicillin-binding transpeptidase domain-containing protein [Clostridia bacterium]